MTDDYTKLIEEARKAEAADDPCPTHGGNGLPYGSRPLPADFTEGEQ